MPEASLRPMREDDLADVLEWRNADRVRHKMYSTHAITPDEHRAWWERARTDQTSRLLIFEYDGIATAAVHLSRYSGPDGTATLGFFADPQRRHRHIGAALEFLAFEYAFECLRVRRLDGEIIEFNVPVLRLSLRQGARLEGVRRKAYWRDGKGYDVYHVGMLREDWDGDVREALAARRDGGSARFDLTGRAIRCTLAAAGERVTEAQLAARAAAGIIAAVPEGQARLVAQSIRFSQPLDGQALSLRARIATHLGQRLLCLARVFDGTREVAGGHFEFALGGGPAGRGEPSVSK